MPRGFSEVEKVEWRRLVVELRRFGLLVDGVELLLEPAVRMYGTARAARRLVDREGLLVEGARGQLVPHPALAIERDSLALYRALLGDVGLSPAARRRLAADAPPPDGVSSKIGPSPRSRLRS